MSLIASLMIADLNLQLNVLHFDHGLRGATASQQEEAFVRELAGQYNIPVHVRRLTSHHTGGLSASHSNMRKWRLAESQALAQRLDGAPVVAAMAHHLDDQEETLLLKWIRGCHLSRLR